MASIRSSISMENKVSPTLNKVQQDLVEVSTLAEKISTGGIDYGKVTGGEALQDIIDKHNEMLETQEQYNASLGSMYKEVDRAHAAYVKSAKSIGDNNEATVQLKQRWEQVSKTVQETENLERKAISATQDHAKEVVKLHNEFQQSNTMGNRVKDTLGKWGAAIVVANQALQLTQTLLGKLSSAMDFSDQYTLTMTRLNMINDGLQTTDELNKKIRASAYRARVPYQQTADMVSKLGVGAKDAFSNNDEMILFAETLQKSFKIAGTDATGMESAVYNLNQAMASGRLMGNDFKAISDNAPMLAQSIADVMGVTKGELKDLSSQGVITADIVKKALIGSAEEINEEFKNIPRTFADAKVEISNAAMEMFEPVFVSLRELVNSEEFMTVVNTIIMGMAMIAQAVIPVVDAIVTVFSFIINFLGQVAQSIMDNHLLMLTLFTVLGGVLLILTGYFIVLGVQALIAGAKALIGWMMALWPLFLIIAVIALVIAAAVQMGVSFEEVGAFIGGMFGYLGAFIYNVFVRPLWNFIAAFANFFGNVFNDPVYSIKKLFVDVFSTILDMIAGVAGAIDFLLGTDMAGSIGKFQDNLYGWLGESEKYEAIMPELEEMAYDDAWNYGSKVGANVVNKGSSLFDGLGGFGGSGLQDDFGMADLMGNAMGGLDGMSDIPVNVKGGKLDKQEVDISDEDLKMLKDVASREFMVNYKQITPNVNISTGDINEASDAKGLIQGVKEMMEKELTELYVEEFA